MILLRDWRNEWKTWLHRWPVLKWLPANVRVPVPFPNLLAEKPFLWAVGRSRDIAESQDLMKEIHCTLGNNTSIVSTREIAKKG